MKRILPDSQRGLRRLVGLAGAAALALLGLLVILRPHPSLRTPEPIRRDLVRGDSEGPSSRMPAAPPLPAPRDIDPLEASRKAPPQTKEASKGGVVRSTAGPISASVGNGPDRFAIRDRNVNAFFTTQGVTLAVLKDGPAVGPNAHSLNWGLDGAAPVEPQPTGELPTRINRLVGDRSRWQTDLPSYSSIVYDEVKPGVDVSIESQPHALKYTVQLAPGVDPECLRFHYQGADDVQVSADGQSVQVVTRAGVMVESDLKCWQEGPAGKVPVGAHYARTGATGYSILLDSYDPKLPLTVDPVFAWGTFLGGTLAPSGGDDYGYAMTAGADGTGGVASYVSGYTNSADFPTTVGAYQTAHSLTPDCFVAKFTTTGGLVWSTLLGGSNSDYINAMQLDSAGNIVVAGYTYSTDLIPAGTPGWVTTNPTGTQMGFVAKLNTTGTSLLWATYVGGAGNFQNSINALVLDGSNNVYVTGYTSATTFPHSGTAFQPALSGSTDAFVTKILSDGSNMAWSSYLGGTNSDYGAGIAVDSSGNVYVGGYTYGTFPTTGGAYSTVNRGSADCFVTKVNSAGSGIIWSTLIGSTSYDQLTGLCLDTASPPNVVITGYTYKTSLAATDYPVTAGAFQTVHGASYDGFVTKLGSGGNALVWSTYLGGSSSDYPMGVSSYTGTGDIYVAGYTYSTDYPVTAATAYRTGNTGGSDGFVTRLSSSGAMGYSTYIGGSNYDYVYGTCQYLGWVFITGNTSSANYPVVGGVTFPSMLGTSDAFVSRFNPYLSGANSLMFSTFLGGAHGQGDTSMTTNCLALDDSGNAFVAASAYVIDFPGVAGEFMSSFKGTQQNIVVSKIPDSGAPLAWSTYLGGATGYQTVNALTVGSTGAVYLTGYTGSTDFPAGPGYRTFLNGGEDSFVTCLNPDGKSLAFSTFLGGSLSSDYAFAIALDSSANVYVAGYAYSTDFPTTAGVVRPTNGGTTADGFVTKFNPTGTGLIWSTLIGGNSGFENITALAVDSSGSAYVTGTTSSQVDFVTTAGAYSSTFNTTNGSTPFLVKLNPSATALAYSTYFGGTSSDQPNALAVDDAGSAYVGGYTNSSNYPVVGGVQPTFGGSYDGFVTKFNPAGSGLSWSTFLGGSDSDFLYGLAVDASHNVYVTGYTASTNFPMTPPLLTSVNAGFYDAFATRINASGSTLSWSTYLGGSSYDYGQAIAVNSSHNVCVAGYTQSPDFKPTLGALQPKLNGTTDLFLVRINNEPPSVPTGLAQYRSNGTTVIPTGGATNETTVIMKGVSGDPDGDKYMLQVEIRDDVTALTEPQTISTFGVAFWESALTAAGTTATVTVTGKNPGTHYHWAARSVDVAGVASAWVSYGGNTENPPTNPAAIDLQIDQTPPTIAIVNPTGSGTYNTNLNSVLVSGTSSDNVQVFNVTWANSANGTNGTAGGTTNWSIPSINLAAGINAITVTVQDTAGNTTSQLLTVIQDSVPPNVAITVPTVNPTFITASGFLTLMGSYSDNVGVTSVTWANAANSTGGTASLAGGTWTSTAITLVSGLNNLTVKAFDAAGNFNQATLGVTYDPNQPTVSLTSPTIATTFSTKLPSVVLGGTASDPVTSITLVTYLNTNTGGTATNASGTSNWTTGSILLVPGTNLINVTATNAAGTSTVLTVNVIEDTTFPALNINTPTTGPTFITNSSSVTLTGTASDAGGSGLASVSWANPATGGFGTAATPATWTISNIGLNSGSNAITVTATDGAGNATSKTLTVTYDPTPPSVLFTTPSSTPTYTTLNSVNLAGTASDNVAVALVEWRVNGGSYATAGGTTASWTVTGVPLIAGPNPIDVRATDTAGNTFVKSIVINRDNTVPSVSIQVPGSNPFYTKNFNVAMSGTASDNTGVAAVDYQVGVGSFNPASGTPTAWSIPSVALVAGSNTVTVRATDLAGNTALAPITIIQDTIFPSIAITTNNGNNFATNSTPLTLVGTTSDNFVVASVTWTNNGGGSSPATLTSGWSASIPLTAGSNNIVVTATDAAGNSTPIGITVTLDQTLPSVAFTTPTSGTTYSTAGSPLTTLAGTASDNVAVASVQWRVNGGSFAATSGGLSAWNIPSIPLNVGTNPVDVRVTDTAGNIFTKTMNVILDTTPPSAIITTPSTNPAYVTGGPIALAGTASDNNSVALVEWRVVPGAFAPASGTTSWSVPSAALSAGSNTIEIRATDAAGNIFVTSTVVIVDTTAPSVLITTNNGNPFVTNGTPVALAGTASDDFLVAQVQWSNNSGPFNSTGGTPAAWTASIPMSAGANVIVVRATDGAGNTKTASITVTYSTSAPSLAITIPTSNATFLTGSNTVTLGGTASDPTGIQKVEYRLLPSATYITATPGWTTGTITLLPGSNTIQVLATDNASNTSTASLVVTYDNQKPSLAITGPSSSGSFATNGASVSLSGTVSANGGSTMSTVTWSNPAVPASGTANIVGGTWTSTAPVPLASGVQTITVTATDNLGNFQTAIISVNVDLSAPNVTITAPGTPNFRNTTPVLVTFVATDTGSPAASGVTSVGWNRAEGGASGSAVFSSGSTWTANIPLLIGTNTITATATDAAGNVYTNPTPLVVTLDTSLPSLAITSPPPPSYSTKLTSVTLSGTVTANGGSSVQSVSWSTTGAVGTTSGFAGTGPGTWNIPTISLAAGSQVITVTALDTAGNSTFRTLTVISDSTSPTVSIQSPPSPPNGGIGNSTPITLTFQASNPGASGVASVTWSRLEGGGATGSATFSSGTTWTASVPLVAGINTITPSATTGAGVTATGANFTFTLDQTGPTVAVTNPTATGTFYANTLSLATLSGTVSPNGGATITGVSCFNAGTSITTPATVTGTTWSANAAIALTSHTSQVITVTATDSVGNVTLATLTVIQDDQAPTVQITSPTSNPTFTTGASPIVLGGTAADVGLAGLQNVTWTNPQAPPSKATSGTASGTATWSASIDLTGVGVNHITVTATDLAGNFATATIDVTLNTSAPTIAITSPTTASTMFTNQTTVTLQGTAAAAGAATITQVQYTVNGGAPITATGTTIWTTASILLTPDTTNTIVVTATDSTLLPGSSTLTVIQDTSTPQVTITTPANGSFTKTSPIAMSGTALNPGGSPLTSVSWTNGATAGTGPATGTAAWTTSVPLTPGPNVITVTATNAAGTSGSTPVTITYDVVAPTLAITAPVASGGSLLTSSPFLTTLAGTSSDDNAVATVDYRINGGTWTATAGPVATWNVPSISLIPGSNVILVRATDTAGNTDFRQITVTLDSSLPTVAIAVPTSGASYITNQTPLLLAGTASDNLAVASVSWTNAANGSFGTANGTTSWTATGIPLVAGSNVLTVTSTDSAGNLSFPAAVLTVTLDTTAPGVTITSPASFPFLTNTTSVTLIGTANDNVALATVTATNAANGATGTFSGSLGAWTFTGIPLVSGANLITVTATDTAGNATNKTVTVNCDPTPPVLAITAPTSGATYLTGNSPILISGTASDNLAVASVTWSNSAGGSGTASGTTAWSASVGLSSGSNVITFTATDTAGNVSLSSVLTVTLYTTKPLLAITSPPGATFATNASPISLVGTASDPQGITSVSWSNAATGGTGSASGTTSWTASVPLAIGDNPLTVTATDGAGNTQVATVTVTLDTTAPTVAITGPTASATLITAVGTLALSGTTADNVAVQSVSWSTTGAVVPSSGLANLTGGGNWSLTSNINLAAGSQLITVIATDTAGNTATTSLTVILDSTAPTVAITSPTSLGSTVTGGANLAIGGTAADNVAVANVAWSRVELPAVAGTAAGTTAWSATVPLLVGTNTFNVVATDSAGNVSGTATLVVTRDITAPSLAITGPTSFPVYFTRVSPVVLSGTATDADGIASVTWSNAGTSGSGAATYAAPTWDASVPLEVGVNVITVTATDVAGNPTTSVLTVTLDVSPPSIAISAPTVAPTFVTKNGTLALSGGMSDNIGVTSVQWSTTGAVLPSSGPAFLNTSSTWSVGSINLALGSQIITVTALDAAGNSSTAVLTVIQETTAPGVTITGPTSAGAYITKNASILLSGTASDAVAVSSVTWTNSTGGSGTAVGTTSWNASIPLVAGLNTIIVTAIDAAGITNTDQIAVTFDATPPTVAITAPTGGATFFTNQAPVLLGGTAADNLGLASVQWSNAATGGSGTATGTASWTASVPLAIGTNPITVTSTDIAGNVSLPSLLNITLDTVSPSVLIALPTNQPLFVTNGTSIDLSGTAADNVGVSSVSCVNAANGAVGVVVGTTSWSVTSLALVAGDNSITVTATDQSGNSSSAGITIRQDSVAPTVAITLPTASGTTFTKSSPLSIGGTASDNVAVSSVSWSNPAVPASGTATGTASWSAAIPLVPGLNTITVTATDTAGNFSTAVLLATLSTASPSVTTLGPTNQPTFSTASPSVTVTGTATDPIPLASVTWTNAATGAVGTTVGTNAWSAPIALTAGTNLITITATDAAGNQSISTISVINDNQAPTISVTAPTSAANFNSVSSPLLVSGTASDNVTVSSVTWSNSATGGSGTAAGTNAWNASIPLVLGANQITLTAFDEVGNATSRIINVTFDPGAPTIAIIAPTSNPTYLTTVSPLDFSGTASDDLLLASVSWTNTTTGVSGVAIGTSAWTASVPLASGPNAIVFTATAGVGTVTTASITVTLDITPPVVTIVSPVPPTVTTQIRPLVISGTATDDTSVAHVSWSNSLTGASGAAVFTDPTWTASIPLIPGANVITVKASDSVGNVGSATLTVNFSLETIPPILAIDPSLLPSFASPTQLATVFGTASDNIAVTSVSWVNKTTRVFGDAIGTTSWTASIPLTVGSNLIEITASDDAGNLTTQDVTVTFAAAAQVNPPNVSITAPTTSSTYTAVVSPLNLQCTAIDAVGVVTVTWYNQATFGTGICGWGTSWYAAIPLASGLNPITVTATDTSGLSATATIAVTYKPPVGDPIPPVVSIVSPVSSGTATVTVPVVSVSGTASDNASVLAVTYNNSATGQGATAAGTTAWSANSIPLMTGVNVITAMAVDPSGNVGQSTLVVVYTPPAAAKPVAPTIPAGMCGCTGLEPLLVLGAIWLGRRGRRRAG